MRYLLETDTLASLMVGAPPHGLLRRVAAVQPFHQATSAIAVGELLYGARRFGGSSPDAVTQVATVIEDHLVVCSFDERAAHCYADLAHRRVSLPDRDLRVASIALAK